MKNSFVTNSIMGAYQRYYLKKEISDGFKAQTDDDIKEAILGFDGYLELIEKSNENC